MISRSLISRVWYISTITYLVIYLAAVGYASHGTFAATATPLVTLLAAPIFLSAGGLGVHTGTVYWVGVGVERAKHPISFWSITVCILGLGGFLLVSGIHDLFNRR